MQKEPNLPELLCRMSRWKEGDGLEVRINGDRINGGFVGVTTYSYIGV